MGGLLKQDAEGLAGDQPLGFWLVWLDRPGAVDVLSGAGMAASLSGRSDLPLSARRWLRESSRQSAVAACHQLKPAPCRCRA